MSPSPRTRHAGRRLVGVAVLAAALLAGLALAPSPVGAVVPAVTVPGPIVVSPGSSLALTGAAAPRVADPDSSILVVQVRAVDVADGSSVAALTLDGTTGLTVLSGDPTGGTAVKVRGTTTRINDALDGLRIDAEHQLTDLGMLSITADDDVTTPDAQLGFTNLRVVDLPPTLVAPTTIGLVADETLDPSGPRELGVSDVEAEEVSVTLSTLGTDPDPLRLPPVLSIEGAGGTIILGDMAGARRLQIIGPPGLVDLALRRVRITAPHGGVFPMVLTADDRAGPGGNVVQRTVTLKVSAVAPVLAVPSALFVSAGVDAPLLAPGAQAAVADRDSTTIEMSILAMDGGGSSPRLTFDLPVTAGVTVTGGQTTDATQVQLQGAPTALDAAVRAMTVRALAGVSSPRLIWRIDDVPGPETGRFSVVFTGIVLT